MLPDSVLPESVAVVAPHADDETLGCAGLMRRVAAKGGLVQVWCFHTEEDERVAELRDAVRLICEDGHQQVICLGWDRWFDEGPLSDLVGTVEALLGEFRPEAVLIPNQGSFHHEHALLAKATIAACRPAGGTDRYRPRVLAMYEEVTDGFPSTVGMEPDWFVEMGAIDVARKVAAMNCHRSQARPAPSERSSEAIEALATVRGAQAGFRWAEAYRTLFRGVPY